MCSLVKNKNDTLTQYDTEKILSNIQNGVYIKEEVIIDSDDSVIHEASTYSVDAKDAAIKKKPAPRNISAVQTDAQRTAKGLTENPAGLSTTVRFYCPKCDKSSWKRRHERQNMCKDCGIRYKYECGICKKHYNEHSSVYRHLKFECNKEPAFKCPVCPYRGSRSRYLRKHVERVHMIRNPRTYPQCSKCGKRYKQMRDKTEHEKVCGLEPYLKCKQCEYLTYDVRYLRSHMLKNHKEIELKDYHTCHKCGKSYKFKAYLATHLKSMHSGLRYMTCIHCKYRTYLKSRLRNHIQKNHHPDSLHK